MVAIEYYMVQVVAFAVSTAFLLLGITFNDAKTAFYLYLLGVFISILSLSFYMSWFFPGGCA